MSLHGKSHSCKRKAISYYMCQDKKKGCDNRILKRAHSHYSEVSLFPLSLTCLFYLEVKRHKKVRIRCLAKLH